MKDEFKEMLKLFGVAPDLLNMDNIISKGEKQQQQYNILMLHTGNNKNCREYQISAYSDRIQIM